MKGSTLFFLILYGVILFTAGFLVHKFMTDITIIPQTTYLERLTRDLELTQEQQGKIIELLDEEDRMIRRILDDELGKEILDRISVVRKETADRIRNLLEKEQQQLFEGLQPGTTLPDQIK